MSNRDALLKEIGRVPGSSKAPNSPAEKAPVAQPSFVAADFQDFRTLMSSQEVAKWLTRLSNELQSTFCDQSPDTIDRLDLARRAHAIISQAGFLGFSPFPALRRIGRSMQHSSRLVVAFRESEARCRCRPQDDQRPSVSLLSLHSVTTWGKEMRAGDRGIAGSHDRAVCMIKAQAQRGDWPALSLVEDMECSVKSGY